MCHLLYSATGDVVKVVYITVEAGLMDSQRAGPTNTFKWTQYFVLYSILFVRGVLIATCPDSCGGGGVIYYYG